MIFINRLAVEEIGKLGFLLLIVSAFFGGCDKSADPSTVAPTISQANAEKSEDEQRGEQILAEYLKRDAAPFRKSRVRFTVASETEPAKIYELDIWRKQNENKTLTLTQIVKPSEDNDLASLITETKDRETVITTYISSTKQFRETGSYKSFFGGVPAQELLGEWSKYNYRLIGEKDLNGAKVFEVEGKLAQSKDSPVAQIKALFRADNYLPAELRLFNSAGKELRAFRIKKYQTEGGRTYVSRTEIENRIYKTQITIDVLSMSFPDKIEDSTFTREKLRQIAQK